MILETALYHRTSARGAPQATTNLLPVHPRQGLPETVILNGKSLVSGKARITSNDDLRAKRDDKNPFAERYLMANL